MVRAKFAGRPGDSIVSLFSLGRRQVLALPADANGDPTAVTLTVWDAPDGTQLTDLLAADGSTAITAVVVPVGGQIPEFYGPDGVLEVYLRDPEGDFTRIDVGPQGPAGVADDASMTAVGEDEGSDFRAFLSDMFVQIVEAPLDPTRPEYGVLANGSANDTAAWQAVANAIPAAGGDVRMPVGISVFSGDITFPETVALIGRGPGASIFQTAAGNIDGLVFEGSGSRVRDLTVRSSAATCTAGAGIVFADGNYSSMQGVLISNWYDLFRVVQGHGWAVANSVLVDAWHYGAYIRNLINADAGDGFMGAGTTIDTSKAGAASALRIESGGGTKLAGVKMLNFDYGLDLQVADGASTSVLTVASTSIESQREACIRLGRLGTTGIYSDITLDGSVQLTADQAAAGVLVGAGISRATIKADIKGDPLATIGVNLAGGDGHMVVGSRLFNCLTGVQVAAGVPDVSLGANHYDACGSYVIDSRSANSGRRNRMSHVYGEDLGAITSTTTYTNLFRVDVGGYQGVDLEVVVSGILQGVGAVQSRWRYALKYNGTSTATQDGTTFHGGAAVDLQLDTSTPGTFLIGVRRNAAAGGTQLNGTIEVTARGSVTRVGQV